MPLKGGAICITCIAMGVFASISVASVDDLSLDTRAGDRSISAAPDVRIPQAVKPDANQAVNDVRPRVEDLEATKAAVNHGVGPAVSLSVSGWVGEQVIMAK